MAQILGIIDSSAHVDQKIAAIANTYPAMRSTPPNPSVAVAYIDTSTVPPVIKGWNGSAWVAIGTTVTNNGDGTFSMTN